MHYVWYFDSYMWDLSCFLRYHTIWILPQSMRDRTKTSITINNLFHQNDNSHCLSFSSTFECLVFFKKYPSGKISHDCKLSKYNNTFIKIWFTSVTSDYNLFDFAALMIYYWCRVDHLSGAWSTINRWNPRKISKKIRKVDPRTENISKAELSTPSELGVIPFLENGKKRRKNVQIHQTRSAIAL